MKMIIPLLLLILGITVLPACGSKHEKSGTTTPPSLDTTALKSVQDMHADLATLRAAIQEMHPGYGLYTTADSMQMAYHKVYAAIQSPLTESQFITTIYPFICSLRCGHTQIRHSENYKPPAQPQPVQLPFEVLVRNHRAWITRHQTDQLNTGDEIISINDVPVSTIINHGYDFYSGDGYNETFKELFLSEYDGFADVCHMYYHWQEPYRLQLRTGLRDSPYSTGKGG